LQLPIADFHNRRAVMLNLSIFCFEVNEKYFEQRFVFTMLMLTLAIAGLAFVFINTMSKANPVFRQVALTKALWKFDPQFALSITKTEQRRAWYKLVCAGVMLASVVASLLIRFVNPRLALTVATVGLSLWFVYLFIYWYLVVETEPTKTVDSTNQVNKIGNAEGALSWITREKRKDADQRLPVTIITGFLGSGKTTVLKHMLNNTVGLKILVIENEIGDEGIDHELLMQHTKKEDVILMNNGCICCTGEC
jgi:hypothetical protein